MRFPLLSDINKNISRNYDVLLENEGIALRGLFVIDPNGVLKIMSVNDLPIGRSVDETLRLIQALQFVEKHGEGLLFILLFLSNYLNICLLVCPANWTPNSKTIKPDPKGSKEYFKTVD